jgi:hypothetical protein
VGDDTHDALAVMRRQSLPGVADVPGQAVDPHVRIEVTSTMVGSSSPLVIAPIAVPSMPMLREAASGLRETVLTVVP